MPPAKRRTDPPEPPQEPTETEAVTKSKLGLEIVMVDAGLATEWLELNSKNRTVRQRRVVEFRRDMLDGNWREVGDPIRFDTTGQLIDGQHRLEAIVLASKVKADLQIPMVIARGVRPEDHTVIDTGTRRTASDQLRIAGFSNFAILAAAAKWCILWDRKALYSDTLLKSVTHMEVLDYVTQNPDLQTIAAEVGSGMGRKIDVPNGYIAACWYICWRVDHDAADQFFGRFADGIGLYDGDPILALRNRLRDVVKNRGNLSGDMYLSVIFRAWNAKREGRQLRALPLDRQGTPIPAPGFIV